MPRPWAETLERRAQRVAAEGEVRRRELRERYPDLAAQVFNNVGDGIGGAGLKALRAWLRSIEHATKQLKR